MSGHDTKLSYSLQGLKPIDSYMCRLHQTKALKIIGNLVKRSQNIHPKRS